MMRGLLTLATFISVVCFPWPFSAVLAIAAGFLEPLVPLAAGIFADTLYYVPAAHTLPFFSLYGLGMTIVAFLVRSQLSAGSMKG